MPDQLTLIHLVSDQTMQNLLPLLAIRPKRVIQILSKEPRFGNIAQSIEHAAKSAGQTPEFLQALLPDRQSDVDSVHYTIKQHLSVFPTAIVNLTGGTKLMSIGAYLGASEFPAVPILYCDTVNKQFIQAGKASLPADLPTFDEVATTLNIPTVMAAHGKSEADWKFDEASPKQLQFGETAWQIRNQNPNSFAGFGKSLRDFFRNDRGRIPTRAGSLQALATADLTSAFKDDLQPPVLDFLDAAAEAGFLCKLTDGGYRPADGPVSTNPLRSHLEKIANILDGSWLELAVLAFVSASPNYCDARWSVEPSKNGQASAAYGETDLIAVNTKHCSLEIISCKTVLDKPLEYLEGLRTRATNLGGSHAQATLALLNAGATNEQTRLRCWGKLLKINVIIGDEIPRYFQQPH